MLHALASLIKTPSSIQDSWNVWEAWQFTQPASHYDHSYIFKYYLYYRPQFDTPHNSVMFTDDQPLYSYCFGDFAPLIVNPRAGTNTISYIELLVDVYDVCKGYLRRFSSDPQGIKVLRDMISQKNITAMNLHDFKQYSYPIEKLHAHTVCQYSLSTLILRFASHFFNQISGENGDTITPKLCREAYENNFFGKPPSTATTLISSAIRCPMCNHNTERIYGKFSVCVDCHTKTVCSECGASSSDIDTDNLPKCSIHLKPS